MKIETFTAHGIEFEVREYDDAGPKYYWRKFDRYKCDVSDVDFLTIEAARADALAYAETLTTGTVPSNRKED